jgi:hypothetical protein
MMERDRVEHTKEQKEALAAAFREAAKVLVDILIDEELQFDFNEASDYITIDTQCVQEITTAQLIEIFGSNRKDTEEVGMNMFIVKGDDRWSDEAFFEVYDLSDPKKRVSKKDPNHKRGGEKPALLIRFREDL